MKQSSIVAAVAAFLVAVAVGSALAQPPGRGMGPMGPMMYDTAKEVAVSGTVQDVKQMHGMRGMTGTHLIVKTTDAVLDVHVGPTPWLADQKYEFAAGDSLQIVGSRVTLNGVDSLIAREITKGETKMTLRDESGRPLWRGGMGRR